MAKSLPLMTAKQARETRVDHPEFRRMSESGVQGYPVAVFYRRLWKEPTETQIEEYRRNKAVVEQHGGRMVRSEYECAGNNNAFTTEECQAMRAAVEASLPNWSIRTDWNGAGYFCYSVSIQPKE